MTSISADPGKIALRLNTRCACRTCFSNQSKLLMPISGSMSDQGLVCLCIDTFQGILPRLTRKRLFRPCMWPGAQERVGQGFSHLRGDGPTIFDEMLQSGFGAKVGEEQTYLHVPRVYEILDGS
jgi:hypothetical protein